METVYLHGSEDVARAASTMRSAAADMQRAADTISTSLEQHQRFLDDWLQRLSAVMETRTTP